VCLHPVSSLSSLSSLLISGTGRLGLLRSGIRDLGSDPDPDPDPGS
jgi:hypothetical protein